MSRQVYFPMMNEKCEVLDYLVDTVLMQTGTLRLEYATHAIEVFTIANPYNPTKVTYCASIIRGNIANRRWPAKYFGFVTDDTKELTTFIEDYDFDEERLKNGGEDMRPAIMKPYKKKSKTSKYDAVPYIPEERT